MTNSDVAAKFADGLCGKSQLSKETGTPYMESDGLAIYSYGRHFPIAIWLNPGRSRAAFCNDSYSSSTNKHQAHVRSALNHGIDLTFVSADDIKGILRLRERQPEESLVILKIDKYVAEYDPMAVCRRR